MHLPPTGVLPDLHKTQVFYIAASHLLHPVTNFKHSLLTEVDFVQVVLSALRSYPVLHVMHLVESAHALQLLMQESQTFPFK